MLRKAPLAPKVRARSRAHRCYELVGQALVDLHQSTSAVQWEIVHGTYRGGLGHAWLEHADGWAFDAVKLEMLPTRDYYAKYEAAPERRYDVKALAEMIERFGIWGPFH